MTTKTTLTPEILVPRIGDYLVDKGIISSAALFEALKKQTRNQPNGEAQLLGKILVDQGTISQAQLDEAITEQILQLRNALEESNRSLEKRVAQRTIELQDALEKLSELDRMKSNFISNISHELRTPLTHIKGYEELLLSGLMGPLNEQQTSAITVIQQAAERLERLIDDLINFSLIAKGEIHLKLVSVNLNPILSNVVNHTRYKAQEREIDINLQLPDQDVRVSADEDKLAWVVMQLMDNAIKFSPQKGTIFVRLEVKEGEAIIQVKDTGIGIPPDRIHEIFEPFHQLDESSTRHYGGTGLGLALVRQILIAHQSNITVHSKVGEGSTFEFRMAILQDSGAEKGSS